MISKLKTNLLILGLIIIGFVVCGNVFAEDFPTNAAKNTRTNIVYSNLNLILPNADNGDTLDLGSYLAPTFTKGSSYNWFLNFMGSYTRVDIMNELNLLIQQRYEGTNFILIFDYTYKKIGDIYKKDKTNLYVEVVK